MPTPGMPADLPRSARSGLRYRNPRPLRESPEGDAASAASRSSGQARISITAENGTDSTRSMILRAAYRRTWASGSASPSTYHEGSTSSSARMRMAGVLPRFNRISQSGSDGPYNSCASEATAKNVRPATRPTRKQQSRLDRRMFIGANPIHDDSTLIPAPINDVRPPRFTPAGIASLLPPSPD